MIVPDTCNSTSHHSFLRSPAPARMSDDMSENESYESETASRKPAKRAKNGDWVPAKQTKRYKESHKQTEKCRRDKINQSIKSLAHLLPSCNSRTAKPDKLTVLSQTVDYIKTLKKEMESGLRPFPSLTMSAASSNHSPDGTQATSESSDVDWSRLVVENISDVLFVLNTEGQLMHLSPSWRTVLGHPVSELLHRRLTDVIHPHDADYITWHIGRYQDSAVDFIGRFRKGTGQYLWLGVRGCPYLTPDGKTYVIAIGRPYEGLSSEEAANDEFVSKHSLDTKWIFVSQSISALLGYRPDELIGTYPLDLKHPEEDWDMRVGPSPGSGQQARLNCRWRHRQGHYVWVDLVVWSFVNPVTNTPDFLFCRGRLSQQQHLSRSMEPIAYANGSPKQDKTTSKGLLAGLVQLRDENMELRQQILPLQLSSKKRTVSSIPAHDAGQQVMNHSPNVPPRQIWDEHSANQVQAPGQRRNSILHVLPPVPATPRELARAAAFRDMEDRPVESYRGHVMNPRPDLPLGNQPVVMQPGVRSNHGSPHMGSPRRLNYPSGLSPRHPFEATRTPSWDSRMDTKGDWPERKYFEQIGIKPPVHGMDSRLQAPPYPLSVNPNMRERVPSPPESRGSAQAYQPCDCNRADCPTSRVNFNQQDRHMRRQNPPTPSAESMSRGWGTPNPPSIPLDRDGLHVHGGHMGRAMPMDASPHSNSISRRGSGMDGAQY